MKFPTYEEMAQKAAEQALDEILINGKTLREWICLLSDELSILEKIRAEIEEQVLESLSDGGDDWFAAEKVNECLEIIDQYTAEGSDKE